MRDAASYTSLANLERLHAEFVALLWLRNAAPERHQQLCIQIQRGYQYRNLVFSLWLADSSRNPL